MPLVGIAKKMVTMSRASVKGSNALAVVWMTATFETKTFGFVSMPLVGKTQKRVPAVTKIVCNAKTIVAMKIRAAEPITALRNGSGAAPP